MNDQQLREQLNQQIKDKGKSNRWKRMVWRGNDIVVIKPKLKKDRNA